jgi:uncharacterized membrane protein
MSLLWLLFITLTVVGGLAYNVAMKYGSANANVFGFAVIISLAVLTFQTAVALVARYAFKIDVTSGINPQTAKFAILAGLGAALIDLNYFLAVRNGSVMASQLFWTIGSITVMAIFAALFLGESITATKAAGIVLGIASVLLITRS